MSEQRKEYPVPRELAERDDEYVGLLTLRDRYVSLRLTYRLAKRASIEAVRIKKDFWNGIYELYPEIEKQTLRYDRRRRVVYEEEQ